MMEILAEKFKTRLAHNGGEAIICRNYDIAAKYIAGLAKSESSEPEHAETKAKIYLSKALNDGFAAKLTAALSTSSDFILPEAISDDADICAVPAAALLAEEGAAVVDAAKVAHEETLFGSISVLVADGGTEFYNNMAEFFCAAAAGKSSVRPDKTVIIAGPSKTADIEKQVVLGMHGPKKLVCLVIV